MQASDLNHTNLTSQLLRGYDLAVPRGESASFLAWFLKNIFRLDDAQATDAICDSPRDRGIDAIYVDHDNSKIVFLQSKIRRTGKAINSTQTREFGGAIAQFATPEKVEEAINSDPDTELSRLLKRARIADRLREGFVRRSVLVTNSVGSKPAETTAALLDIEIYDRHKIAERYRESDGPERI